MDADVVNAAKSCDQSLDHAHQEEQLIPPEEPLPGPQPGKLRHGGVHVDHGGRQQGAHKQGQHDVIRGHGAAVGGDFIHGHRLHGDGVGQIPGQRLGVVFQHVQKAAEAVAGDNALHIVRQLPQVPPQGGRQLDGPAQGGARGLDGVLIPAQLIAQGRQAAGYAVKHALQGLELFRHIPVQLLHPLVDAFADAQSRLPQVLADLVHLGLDLPVPGLQLAGVLQLFQQVPKLPDVVNGVAQPLLDGRVVVGKVPQLLQPLLLLRQPLIQPLGGACQKARHVLRRSHGGGNVIGDDAKLVVDVLQLPGDLGLGFVQAAHAPVQGVLHAGQVAGSDDAVQVVGHHPGTGQNAVRLVHQGLHGRQGVLQGQQALLGAAQLVNNALGHIVGVQAQSLAHRADGGNGVGHGFHHRGVDLVLHGGFGLVGDFGGNGVFLLIFVILDLGMPQVRVQNADKVPGEVRGNDQGGIVLAGADALQGLLPGIHKVPAHLVVAFQTVQHHGADVQLQAQQLIALVLAGNGHPDVGRGVRTIGVPVGENVEPGVQARDQAQAHDDHHGHHAGADALPVGPEDFPDIFHFRSSLVRFL